MSSTTPPSDTKLPHAWSSLALLAKSQRYAEEMLEYPREDWRFVLWLTFVLELLARAALANISPTLLAETTGEDGWRNVYFALGHSPNAQRFVPRSLGTAQVLKRLHEIHPSLTKELHTSAALHVERRNSELYSGNSEMDALGTSTWLPQFYEGCGVFLEIIGSDLKTLIGVEEADAATELMQAAKDETAKAVLKNVNAHKLVWEEKPQEERDMLSTQSSMWATKNDGHRVDCPACKCRSLVSGSGSTPPLKRLTGDLITETQQYWPSRFECIACGLKISGLSQLTAAGLGDSFTSTIEYDASEYYVSDDPAEDWEPDFNEGMNIR